MEPLLLDSPSIDVLQSNHKSKDPVVTMISRAEISENRHGEKELWRMLSFLEIEHQDPSLEDMSLSCMSVTF